MLTIILDEFVLTERGQLSMKMFMDINVTDSFLDLNENVRGCQSKEKFAKCLQTKYADQMMKECGCVSVQIALQNQV